MRSVWYVVLLLSMMMVIPGFVRAVPELLEGNYNAGLYPEVNESRAEKIEKRLYQIHEIQSVDVKPEDSTLRFTVKENAEIDAAKIANAIERAVPGTELGDPALTSELNTAGASGSSDNF